MTRRLFLVNGRQYVVTIAPDACIVRGSSCGASEWSFKSISTCIMSCDARMISAQYLSRSKSRSRDLVLFISCTNGGCVASSGERLRSLTQLHKRKILRPDSCLEENRLGCIGRKIMDS